MLSEQKYVNVGGYRYQYDETKGVAPYFVTQITNRMQDQKSCNIVLTGEGGVGKSYMAVALARIVSNSDFVRQRFTVDDVVYTYSQYLKALMERPKHVPVVFDEPSYALSKREWYKEIQQALVKTLESQRFMLKPLFIPIINIELIDKTVRDYLLQYHVILQERGRGMVYRLSPSHVESKMYRLFVCEVEYGLLDNELCSKRSCLSCRDLEDCQVFRAQYERKKRAMQMERYTADLDEVQRKESQQITLQQLIEKAYPIRTQFTGSSRRIDVNALRIALREQYEIQIGHNKSYELRAALLRRYPNDFASRED